MKNDKIFNVACIMFLLVCLAVCVGNIFVVDRESRYIFILLSVVDVIAIAFCCTLTVKGGDEK